MWVTESWPYAPSFRRGTAAKSLQSCLTLCNPIDGSPPGSPVPGILQARTLEWVAISFSNVWKWKVKVKSLSRVWPSATPWTAAPQAPPSMGFSRQEYWSGVPLPSPQERHKPGQSEHPMFQAEWLAHYQARLMRLNSGGYWERETFFLPEGSRPRAALGYPDIPWEESWEKCRARRQRDRALMTLSEPLGSQMCLKPVVAPGLLSYETIWVFFLSL